jgi:hypothetical protein
MTSSPLRHRLLGLPLAILSIYSLWYFLLNPEIYVTCREVKGFYGVRLELRWGHFWYSSYSDAGEDEESSGSYTTQGNTITFNGKVTPGEGTWVMDRVNGVPVLWRHDGWEVWKKDSRIHPYGILIRARRVIPFVGPSRPSVYSLYTPDMFAREKKEYEERFNDQPPQVRSLMRLATTDMNIPWEEYKKSRDQYRSELREAQETITPTLVGPLIALLGNKDINVRLKAERILFEIYGIGYALKEVPSFVNSDAERARALAALVEALPFAKNKDALVTTVGIFLVTSGIRTIDLPISAAGVRIHLEGEPMGWRDKCDNLAIPPKTSKWEEEMPMIVSVCQKWMKAQFSK